MSRHRAINVEIHKQPSREMTDEEEQVGDAEQVADTESSDGTQSDGFRPRLEESRAEYHMLTNADPSYASENVVLEGHISDGVVGNVAGKVMSET